MKDVNFCLSACGYFRAAALLLLLRSVSPVCTPGQYSTTDSGICYRDNFQTFPANLLLQYRKINVEFEQQEISRNSQPVQFALLEHFQVNQDNHHVKSVGRENSRHCRAQQFVCFALLEHIRAESEWEMHLGVLHAFQACTRQLWPLLYARAALLENIRLD
jgi:hypothetical protein